MKESEEINRREKKQNIILFLGTSTILILIVIAYIMYNHLNPPINYNKLAIDAWNDNVQKSIGNNDVFKGTKDIEVTQRVSGVEGDLVVSGTLIGTKENEEDVAINFTKTKDGIQPITTDQFYKNFTSDINEFIENNDEEKSKEKELLEIRHTIIHDYQDILYGMRGKSSQWNKVKLSQNDDDYTVQETSDRFFGGEKAYLVIVDSQWIYKNGDSEWKQICLHMEYDKDNKLIDAKYDYNHDPDPDKDIKNGVKADTESTKATLPSSSKEKSMITQKDAVEIVKKVKKVDENVSSVIASSDFDKTVNGVKYYEVEIVSTGGHGAALTCYVNSQTGEEIDLISKEDEFNKILNGK